ncbi:MAG TPA: hypothetical protein VK589_02775 [Chryseolinea sp.]|nr:hypothetical protein [Chryseolinea sp.]
MKLLNNLKIVLIVASVAFACAGSKEQQDTGDTNETASDTVSAAENLTPAQSEQGIFVGEYLIGDGDMYIVPVGDTFEMQDGTGKASDVFTFQGKENDTLSVYSNQDKSVTFKMNPDHKKGRYYAPGEELPVELVGPLEQ